MTEKTLDVKSYEEARAKIPDVQGYGNGDLFRLLSKASSRNQGWMKSAKGMEIRGVGVVVQVTTQQQNPDGSYAVAEAVCFVPGVHFGEDENGNPALVSDR